MTFFFLDRNGSMMFRRSDAVEFKHYCEEYACEGIFPLTVEHPITTGMIVAWQDDDDAWEAHEITTVEVDAYGDDVTIAGCSIAVTELRDTILDKIRYEGKTLIEVLDGMLSGTGWVRGIIPAGADTDQDRRERYRTRRKTKLRNKASSSGKALGTYKKGAYVTLINKTSNSWYKVETADNRIGWMAVNDLTRDGMVDVQSVYQVTATEDFIDVWTLLEDACTSCGTLPRPRVEIERSGIVGRYIDVQSKTPEFHGVRLTCNTNVREAGVKYDTSQLYTAMKGIGKKDKTFSDAVWSTANGNPVDKPKGQNYVASPTALALYGHNGRHRMGVARFNDIDNASALLRATWEQLQVASAPRVQIDCTIADLYALGYGGQSMRLYDLVHIVLQPIGLRVAARVDGLTRDLVRPERTQPVIGTLSGLDILADLVGTANSANRINSWQIRSVNGAAIDSGTVGTQQLAPNSITADQIAAHAVTADAIAAEAVNADAIAAGSVTTAHLAAGAVTAETIAAGTIAAGMLTAINAVIETIQSGTGTFTNLNAAFARLQVLTAGSAEFDKATVAHLVADALHLTFGVGEDVFIENMRVLYAQMADATIGNLCIRASDGNYYAIDVSADGTVTATSATVSEGELDAGQTAAGRTILETDITADSLSTGNLLGTYALINKIDAARLDVDTLLARQAFVDALYAGKIFGGQSMQEFTQNIGRWMDLNDPRGFVIRAYDIETQQPLGEWENILSDEAYILNHRSYGAVFTAKKDVVTPMKLSFEKNHRSIIMKSDGRGGVVWVRG